MFTGSLHPQEIIFLYASASETPNLEELEFRTTRIGTVLYFSSEAELRYLFNPYFRIDELKTIQVNGKNGDHLAVYAFMHRK